MKFWVNVNSTYKEVAVDFVLDNLNSKFSALIVEGTKIQFNVTTFEVGAIRIIASTFDNINLSLLTELLNKGIEYGLPYFNTYISTMKL
jgi:hypothetical protein